MAIKKLVAFAASNSKNSINKKLVTYASSLVENVSREILDLNDFELPIYSEDFEKEHGIPKAAQDFYDKIGDADYLAISFAEHNGSYTAVYKNIFDWCSRISPKVFQKKSMVIMSTSPGARGGASVLAAAVGSAPFFAGDLKGSLSIPSFFDNFDTKLLKLKNGEINDQLKFLMRKLSR